jgi:hypothetical protein
MTGSDFGSTLRGHSVGFLPENFLNFMGTSFALTGPILFPVVIVGSLIAFRRSLIQREGISLLVAAAFLIPFAFLVQRSFFVEIIPTWPFPFWPFAIAAAAINAAYGWAPEQPERVARAVGRWAMAALVSGFIIVIVTSAHALVDRGAWLGRMDPLGQEAGFGQMGREVAAAATRADAQWIATVNYRTYAMLRWHLNHVLPVVQVNQRSRYIGFVEPDLRGPALLVTRGNKTQRNGIGLPSEATIEQVMSLERTWRGVVFGNYTIAKITGWTPELNQPPGSPLFGALPPCC